MISLMYADVPAAVTSVHVLSWQNRTPPVEMHPPDQISGDSTARVSCTPGTDVVIAFDRSDGAYLLDGPFTCPGTATERHVDPTWRRTLRVRAPADLSGQSHSDVGWVSAGDAANGWPRCAWAGSTAECWGSAVGARGALVFNDGDRVWWTVLTEIGSVADFQSSAWARLIVVSENAEYGSLIATIAQPVRPSDRRASLRLETAPVREAHAVSIAGDVVWVYGEQRPASAWIELRATGAGPIYMPLDEVALAPSSLPLWVTLGQSRRLDGVVHGSRGAAAGAIVTLFRLIDPAVAPGDAHQQPRRVFAEEQVAGAAGEFQFNALGEGDYEVIAWHPQLGRGIAVLARGQTSVTLRLESTGEVRGRVLVDGRPIEGVDVISLPDPDAFAQAKDLTDLKGGDTRTGADGRFVVSLASARGGEVRVGGGSYPIQRFPLPRAPVPIVDLGDIELGSPIEVAITLDRSSACDIRATGPVGRSGLQVILGTRIGPGLFRVRFPEEGMWAVQLLCGHDTHVLVPSLISITRANGGREVRLTLR